MSGILASDSGLFQMTGGIPQQRCDLKELQGFAWMASPLWGSFQHRLAIRRHNNTKTAIATYFSASFGVCKRFLKKKVKNQHFFQFLGKNHRRHPGNLESSGTSITHFSPSQMACAPSEESTQRFPSPVRGSASPPSAKVAGRCASSIIDMCTR